VNIGEEKSLKQVTEQSIRAHNTGTAVLFRWGLGAQHLVRDDLPEGRKKVPILKRVGWAPEPLRTGAEHFAPTGFQSPDRPARLAALTELSRM